MAAGRPNKYESNIEQYKREIGLLRADGVSYSKIAKMLHIAESTLYKHKAEIDEFSESTKKGDNKLIDHLEATLYDLALGRVKTSKTKIVYDAGGNIRSKEETTDVLAPNLGALIFTLTNLASDRWKNKQEISAPDEELREAMKQYD